MTEISTDPITLCLPDPLAQRVIAEQAASRGFAVQFVSETSGAAITIAGPVRLGVLLQRMRQYQLSQKVRIINLGRFLFDPDHMLLINADDEEEIVLTEKESAILAYLVEAGGAVISRRDLLTKVWGYVEGVETHTLETHIYRLRQKLEQDPAKPDTLLTAEQGYSLNF